jgi:hypothetical protein
MKGLEEIPTLPIERGKIKEWIEKLPGNSS